MSINTDGNEEKGTTAIGFVIYDVNGEELVCKGDIDFGTTSNEAELYAILQALSFVVAQGWKYEGDYLYLKSNTALAIQFLTREWKAEAEGLYDLVEAICTLLCKERIRIKWTWIPQSQNVVADAMCHIARKAGGVLE